MEAAVLHSLPTVWRTCCEYFVWQRLIQEFAYMIGQQGARFAVTALYGRGGKRAVPMARIGRGTRNAGALLFAALISMSITAQAERYTIPWFVHATPWFVDAEAGGVPEGVLRILNVTDESGSVEVYSIDDAGRRSGPASFTLDAWAAVEFTATDLQSGNAMLGLTGGIGAKVGDARLQIDTELRIVPLAYVRAADGTLSAMHDTVRAVRSNDGGFEYLVPIFNPSADTVSASQLRLINPGDAAASVTIGARDDAGAAATGGTVELTLAPGAARTLTAQQLEAGDPGLTGRLGAGVGKWRLNVSSDRPIQLVNAVMSASGHMNNLSTTAVAGPAPVDHSAFNERFLGSAIEFRTDSHEVTIAPGEVIIAPGEVTFAPGPGDTFTVTAQSGGVTTTRTGRYGYAALGPDAGRMAVSYDDGSECAANLYFASRSAGWFANNCTAADDPDGYWVAGNWSVADDVDGGDSGEPIATTYGVDESLPGVPASGAFVPSELSGGSVSATDGGTTINLNEGGYFELGDGTRYACASADGCAIANGTVTRGTVTGTAAGTGEVDRFPTFRTAINPGDRTYAAGTAIDPLTLPEATGGNGTLRYNLSPNVPGLSFNAAVRQLTGTPSTPGTYAMTYTVTDEDGDTDNLGFTITVSDGTTAAGSLGVCQVGMSLSRGQSCTYPGTSDEFSVNARGRGSFLGRLAGIRIRINNETINGREYDFEASHQGDGVWRIDRVAGSTEPPSDGETEDSAPNSPDGTAPEEDGPQMFATPGTEVILRSIRALDCAGGADGHQWGQVSGPPVSLSDDRAEMPRFTVPELANGQLAFRLETACAGEPLTDTVTVQAVPARRENVLSALVDFEDVDPADRPLTRTDLAGLLVDDEDSLTRYLSSASRGLLDVRFDVLDWVTVPKRRDDYPVGGGIVVFDVIDRLSQAADLGTYDKVFPAIFPLEAGYPGCAAFLEPYNYATPEGTFRLGAAWLSGYDMGCVSKGRHAHEYGHTFGFVHSLAVQCDNTIYGVPASTIDPDEWDSCHIRNACANDDCTELKAGLSGITLNLDPDMLGDDSPEIYETYFPMVYQSVWQAQAGWLTDRQIVTEPGSHWITTLESLSPTPKALRVSIGHDHAGGIQDYWLETRLRVPKANRYPEQACAVAVRLTFPNGYDASNEVLRGEGDSGRTDTLRFYHSAQSPFGYRGFHSVRPDEPFWDPYRGVRFSLSDCIAHDDEVAVKVNVERSALSVDPPVVATLVDGTARVTVTNGSTHTINIGRPSVRGRHAEAIFIDRDGCTNQALDPDATCDIELSAPTETLSLGWLHIPSDDELAPELAVSLLRNPAWTSPAASAR